MRVSLRAAVAAALAVVVGSQSASGSPSQTPSQSSTPSESDTPTTTRSSTGSNTVTPTQTLSFNYTGSATPTQALSPNYSASATPSQVATPSPKSPSLAASFCGPSGVSQSLNRFDRTYVCLVLNGVVQTVFTPKVDQLAALSLSGSNLFMPPGTGYLQDGAGWVADSSNASLINRGCDVTLYLALDISIFGIHSQYARLYKRITYNQCTSSSASTVQTIALYTAIITVNNGVPTGVSWDDGCFFCAETGSDCKYNSYSAATSSAITSDSSLRGCQIDSTTCYSGVVNSTGTTTTIPDSDCDLKVFVVWTGTDAKGNYMKSVNERFSRFRKFGVADLYQGTLNLGNLGYNTANAANGIVQGVPGKVVNNNGD